MSGYPTPQKVSFNTLLIQKALTSHFICRFQPPPPMEGFLSSRETSGWSGANYKLRANQDLIELACTEASLPGSSLMTNEINDDYAGVTERHAYRRQYDDRLDFSFYVDNDYKIINFFESWIGYCAGENLQTSLGTRNYSYRVNFPNQYQADSLYITKFERDFDVSSRTRTDPNKTNITSAQTRPILTYKFIRAYPINISSMPVSYDSSQLLKCTVSFTFIRYLIENRNVTVKDSDPEEVASPAPTAGAPEVRTPFNPRRSTTPAPAAEPQLPPSPGVPSVPLTVIPFRDESLF